MSNSRQRGLSLIETVIFIVVLGIGIAGLAILYNQLTLASVDPLVRKQAVAIANSLMEEIQLRPFTYCDPDDPEVFTATGPGDCSLPEAIGPEAGETRYAEPRFDNVNDYHLFAMSPIVDITGTPIIGLEAYGASVQITEAGGDLGIPAADALRIAVTVTGPANTQVVLEGYRVRYAPNSP
jgi:MSHA pilin protein MshD